MKRLTLEQYPILAGGKVCLRPITMLDTDLIVKWRNTPSVQKNFIFREPFTTEMHRAWMNKKVYAGSVIQYIIEEKNSCQPIGSVYFRDVDFTHESAEYGIFIGEAAARGKGLGSETAKLFVEFGFKTVGLHRISLRVLAENETAIRSYQHAGFVQEGVFRDMVKLDGVYRDVVFMAVLADE